MVAATVVLLVMALAGSSMNIKEKRSSGGGTSSMCAHILTLGRCATAIETSSDVSSSS